MNTQRCGHMEASQQEGKCDKEEVRVEGDSRLNCLQLKQHMTMWTHCQSCSQAMEGAGGFQYPHWETQGQFVAEPGLQQKARSGLKFQNFDL